LHPDSASPAARRRPVQGRSVGEIEKQTAKGMTRYAVARGSGSQKQELLIDEGEKVLATDAGEHDDD
jgi:hypothetical protein